MKRIKCSFCEKTTTYGVGEKSGFGHAKATVGTGINKIELNLYSCPDHTDQFTKAIMEFFKGIR